MLCVRVISITRNVAVSRNVSQSVPVSIKSQSLDWHREVPLTSMIAFRLFSMEMSGTFHQRGDSKCFTWGEYWLQLNYVTVMSWSGVFKRLVQCRFGPAVWRRHLKVLFNWHISHIGETANDKVILLLKIDLFTCSQYVFWFIYFMFYIFNCITFCLITFGSICIMF